MDKKESISFVANAVHARAEETNGGRVQIVLDVVFADLNNSPVMNNDLYEESALRASDWEGVAITRDHPKSFGYRSAAQIGVLRNAKFADGKMSGEMVIDYKSCEAKGVADLYSDISAGKKYGVSLAGQAVEIVNEVGERNGKRYGRVIKAIEPDSIALLTSVDGACPQPFCGVMNEEKDISSWYNKLKDLVINLKGNNMSESKCNCADEIKPISERLGVIENALKEAGKEKSAVEAGDAPITVSNFKSALQNALEENKAAEEAKDKKVEVIVNEVLKALAKSNSVDLGSALVNGASEKKDKEEVFYTPQYAFEKERDESKESKVV